MTSDFLANDPTQRAPAAHLRYRFGAVEVDTGRGELTVHGQPVEVQPLALRLLILLCEANGAVVSRDDLLSRLWPDQIVVSDESLTKVIHRLRTALGTEADGVRTLRKLGVRLDAALTVVAASPPPPVRSPTPLPIRLPASPAESRAAPPEPPPLARRPRGRRLAVAAVLLLATIAAVAFWVNRPPRLTDTGYALESADLAVSRPETTVLIEQALVAAGAGDRTHARELLSAAQASDPTTPIPAIFLSLWSRGPGTGPQAVRWARAAEQRLQPGSTTYDRLLVQYALHAADDSPAAWAAAAGAILDERPHAWALRLSRAHFHISRRDRQAALADLQLIPIGQLPNTTGAMVLGDRASLGDADGAEADLRASPIRDRAALAAYVRGRIAWSRGDPAAAMRQFNRSVDEATLHNQPDLGLDSRLLAAAMAAELELPSARSLFDQLVAHAEAQDAGMQAMEALGMGAYLSTASGDVSGRDRRLAQAFRLTQDAVHLRIALALAAYETGAALSEDLHRLVEAIGNRTPELLGVPELLLARQALTGGDRATAAQLLADAQAKGIAGSYYAESALLLAAELGQPTAPCKVDPPYPNLLRFGTCARLRRLLWRRPVETGGPGPK